MLPLDRLHIEVTNVCNFKCEFCPDAIMTRRRGHMAVELLEQILTEVAEHQLARILTFHLMGEPLIYPAIFEGIQMALARGLNLHLTTNGSTFHLKPDHVQRLVASGIPKVTISLQTPDPETFTIRGAPPRLAPEDYFEGIAQYVQMNLADDTSPTRVHIKFLDTTPHPFLVPHKPLTVLSSKEDMLRELNQWAQRFLAGWADRPTDVWIEQRLQRYQPGRWQVLELHPKLALEVFPLDSWGNVEADRVIPASFGYCNGASKQAGILYDGTVVPCCKDYEGKIPLGTLQTQTLKAILAGQSACALRQGFDRFQVTHPVCQACIGADSRPKALLRQLGSIAYFKAYTPIMRQLQPGWGDV